MTITEQLAALKATREERQKRLSDIAQKAMDEGRSMNTAEAEEFDTAEVEIKSIDADAVVSNGDIATTYRRLIAPEHRRRNADRRFERMRYSMSLNFRNGRSDSSTKPFWKIAFVARIMRR